MNINLLFPIAQSDRPKLRTFVECLEHFGPYHNDIAVILPTPSIMVDVESRELVMRISKLFGGVEANAKIIELDNDPEGGWPLACNLHWQFAIQAINDLRLDGNPSLWIESDVTPLKGGWVARIKDEYMKQGHPFMGVVVPSRYVVEKNGKRSEVTDGSHMTAVGVYPPQYTKHIEPTGCPTVLWNFPDRRFPFDVKSQREHRPVAHTDLIIHRPRTVNYREVNGAVICDDMAPVEFGHTQAGVVDFGRAVIVHGCKDGSLARLVIESTKPAKASAASAESQKVTPPNFSAPPAAATSEAKETGGDITPEAAGASRGLPIIPGLDVEAMKERWVKENPDLDVGIFWDELDEKIQSISRSMFSKPSAINRPSVDRAKTDREKVVDCLQNSQKRLKLAQVSELTKIPLNRLKALCDEPDAPFVASSGLGWMKLVEATK